MAVLGRIVLMSSGPDILNGQAVDNVSESFRKTFKYPEARSYPWRLWFHIFVVESGHLYFKEMPIKKKFIGHIWKMLEK